MKIFSLVVLPILFTPQAFADGSGLSLIGFDPHEEQLVRESIHEVTGDFEIAKAGLEVMFTGIVEVQSYGYLLSGRQFFSKDWNTVIATTVVRLRSCDPGHAAYVVHDDKIAGYWKASVYLCDAYFEQTRMDQTDTIAHELVHVVHGSGECVPMLFTYYTRALARKAYSFDERYWWESGCDVYRHFLPPAAYPPLAF